jgi:Protein of unknown function (DUF3048) N-terminal domain/Protein of unknown function (DUF3048) C-terminal domain
MPAGGSDGPPGAPGPARPNGRVAALLGAALSTPRRRIVAALTTLVVLVAATVIATAGGSESAAPTTTTSTTTTTAPPTTTTTAPPRPPIYPLTGKPVRDPAVLRRPTLVVKIDNVEPKSRPQIGLNEADIVYEERVEGAVTRFMALFHSWGAVPVGPVRSARTSDIGLYMPLGRPLFAWSGANAIFAERIRRTPIVDAGYDAAPDLYYRDGGRSAPHNLMLDGTNAVWARSWPGATRPASQLFAYRVRGEAPPGRPLRGIRIVFATGPGSAPVEYRWNGRGYARFQNGTPHVDALGRHLAPENVIVSYTRYASSGVNDQFGVPIREAQLVGQGEADILTAGNVIHVRWVKPALNARTQYLDAAGNEVHLTPGRTWVAIAEPGTATWLG